MKYKLMTNSLISEVIIGTADSAHSANNYLYNMIFNSEISEIFYNAYDIEACSIPHISGIEKIFI